MARRKCVEGARTDSRAYQNTTTAAIHYNVHYLRDLCKKQNTKPYQTTSILLHDRLAQNLGQGQRKLSYGMPVKLP